MHRIMFFLLLFAPLFGASPERSVRLESGPSEAGQGELSQLGRKASLDTSHPQTDEESAACGKEIQRIDQQVQKLEKQKQVHQDLARKYQQLGDNWQYSTGNIQDAYANWGRADQERRKAIDLQRQIDLLLERRSRIIQFYPELYQP